MISKFINYKSKYLPKLIGIGIFVFILFNINLSSLLDIITKVNIYYVIIILLLNLPLITIKALRWNLILKMQKIYISKMDSVLIYFSGIYLGVVTPGRLGEFIKILYLKLEKGISMTKGITSVLADRLFDMYLLLMMGIIGIWQFNVLGKLSNTYFALIIVVILTPLLFLNKKLARTLLSLLYYSFIFKRFEGRIEETFEDFYKGVNQLINPRLINTAFLTCVSYLIFYIQCYLLVIAMGLQIDFITIALFMSISNLISFIPISISGLGTRDATLVYLFSLIGLRTELAVGYAFLVFVIFFVFGGLMGAVAWWIKPLNLNIKKDC